MDVLFFLVFLLFVIYLIIGLIRPRILARFFKTVPSRKKICLVLGGASVICFILFAVNADRTISNKTTNQQASQSATPNRVIAADIDKFPATKDLLVGNNNDSPPQPKLRKFEYDPSTGWVNVEFNMDQNLTKNMTMDGLKIDMSKIYAAIYHKDHIPVESVNVDAYGPQQDKYGNISYDRYCGTLLDKDVADKINWNVDEATLELQIIPGLWKTTWCPSKL